MSANIITLNKDNFQDTVMASATPVLVDFWATWCGPCKAIAPVLEDLAAELAGKVTVAKVDIDSNGELAARFSVRAIPTLLIFKNGSVVDTHVGLADKNTLKMKLKQHMA